MSFKDFTLPELVRRFQLRFSERSLFGDVPEHPPSEWLTMTLKETAPLGLALSNEKARSEMIIAPVLVEVRRSLDHRVGLFSGVELDVDAAQGLTGVCDFILSRAPEQVFLTAPLVAVVEAKQENIKGGVGQCAAEMVASRVYNEQAGQGVAVVYGAVTTGDNWRFLALAGDSLALDSDEYLLPQVGKILGIFRKMLA
jgi:hypothetical protein